MCRDVGFCVSITTFSLSRGEGTKKSLGLSLNESPPPLSSSPNQDHTQVAHVRAERDILVEADHQWVVKMYYSFQVISDYNVICMGGFFGGIDEGGGQGLRVHQNG